MLRYKNTILKQLQYLCVLAVLVLAVSCNRQEEKDNKAKLADVEQSINSNPAQALATLELINVRLLSEAEYFYYILLQVRLWELTGNNIANSEKAVAEARDYFINKQDADKAALGCFMAGRLAEAQAKYETAILNYKLAEKWAEKVNNKVTALPYYRIPYNIAALLIDERDFEESLRYVDKALEWINKEQENTTHKLYALDLKASNYRYLSKTDSALYYYNKASEIADNINDATSQNRINYNISALLYNADKLDYAEQKCKEVILSTQSTDSTNLGRLNLALAAINHKKNNNDSAYILAYKAKELLINGDYNTQRTLYNILSKVERSKGNEAKAAQYSEHRERLKTEHENAKKQEVSDIQAEVQKLRDDNMAKVLLFAEQTRINAKKESNMQNIMFLLLGLCIVAICILFYKARSVKMDVLSIKKLFDYGKETMVRQINQRRDLFALLDHIAFRLDISGQRMPLITKMEKMLPELAWNDKPPHMYYQYYKTFERFKSDFPMLKEMEYRILCLLCALDLTNEELADYLLLEYDDYDKTKASMIAKLEKEGQSLDKLIKDTRSKCKLRLQSINLNLN